MPNVILDEQILMDIADAIREMSESTATYTPAQMAQAILNININSSSSGGDDSGIETPPPEGGDVPLEPPPEETETELEG